MSRAAFGSCNGMLYTQLVQFHQVLGRVIGRDENYLYSEGYKRLDYSHSYQKPSDHHSTLRYCLERIRPLEGNYKDHIWFWLWVCSNFAAMFSMVMQTNSNTELALSSCCDAVRCVNSKPHGYQYYPCQNLRCDVRRLQIGVL